MVTTLYRYYDKIIDNIQGAKNIAQLQVAYNMYRNHYKLVRKTIHFNLSKNKRIADIYAIKQKEFLNVR